MVVFVKAGVADRVVVPLGVSEDGKDTFPVGGDAFGQAIHIIDAAVVGNGDVGVPAAEEMPMTPTSTTGRRLSVFDGPSAPSAFCPGEGVFGHGKLSVFDCWMV
jgi:hypothetical protein